MVGAALVGAVVVAPLVLVAPDSGATPVSVILYVQHGATGTLCTGATATHACGSVKQAVTVAYEDHGGAAVTVTVGPGTYTTSSIYIGNGVASLDIDGAGVSSTVVSADGEGRIFSIESGDPVTITGLKLVDSRIETSVLGGGAIGVDESATVTISDDAFSTDAATYGGGVSTVASNVLLSHDTFRSLTGYQAGGCVATTGVDGADTLVLTNDSLTDCYAEYAGGAVAQYGGTVTYRSVDITDNRTGTTEDEGTGDGGGVYLNDGAIAEFTGGTISQNSATGGESRGGGVFLWEGDTDFGPSHAVLAGVTVTTNKAVYGGGVDLTDGEEEGVKPATETSSLSGQIAGINDGAADTETNPAFSRPRLDEGSPSEVEASDVGEYDLTVVDSTFSSNRGDGGGAIWEYGATAAFDDTTFASNSAYYYGAVDSGASTARFTNVTFVTDFATYEVGAFDNWNGSTTTFVDATFATDSTPSIHRTDFETSDTRVTVADSIFSNATCTGATGIIDGGYNVETGDSCLFGATSRNTAAANLGPLAANTSTGPETMAIGPTSAAFELVPAEACTVSTDERGKPRPGVAGANCDAGAYEYQSSASPSGHHEITVKRIPGTTADTAAVHELQSAFPSCPGTPGDRPVVLASDTAYQDSLSSAYLEKYLNTGLLLTPQATLSAVTETALRDEGITHVYVVGGPLAVSTAVVSALEALPVYGCTGTSRSGAKLAVTRIFGTTAAETAAKVADFPGVSFVGKPDLADAYSGLGKDDTTKGASSPSAAAPGKIRTAIVASDKHFQDAESGATLSYAADLPILLTTPGSVPAATTSALGGLGIRQVILLGGPLAVTTAVVTALEGAGVSVLRVAGTTYSGTSVELAKLETASATDHQGFGWDSGHVAGLAADRGDIFQYGLAGAVDAAKGFRGSGPIPLLLTEKSTTIGVTLTNFLLHVGSEGIGSPPHLVTFLLVFGGSTVFPPSVAAQLASAL